MRSATRGGNRSVNIFSLLRAKPRCYPARVLKGGARALTVGVLALAATAAAAPRHVRAPRLDTVDGRIVNGVTTTDFPDTWFPQGFKGHVSDDVAAAISPKMYREFSAPYHARIFEEFGCGGLHNCGPNPCHRAYVAHEYSPRNLDLAWEYSHDDLPRFKESLRKKAFIYIGWPGTEDPVAWYRALIDLMAPDVIVVPLFSFKADEAEEMVHKLRPLAEEYARRIDWGWERPLHAAQAAG